MEHVSIYFEDLKEEVQKELLEAFGIKDPSQMNWDIMPVAMIPIYNKNNKS